MIYVLTDHVQKMLIFKYVTIYGTKPMAIYTE